MASGSNKSLNTHLIFKLVKCENPTTREGAIKTNSSDFLAVTWQCDFMKLSLAALGLWIVQFAVKRLWIDIVVQLVIIERSPAALIPVTASLRIHPHAAGILCVCVCVYVCAWQQSLL